MDVVTPGFEHAQGLFRHADFLFVFGEQTIQAVAVSLNVHASAHPDTRVPYESIFF